MASELKPVKVTVFFPSDMDVSADRAYWYLEGAIRGHWRSFAHDNDPIRGMARASVAVCPLNADTRSAPAATVTGLETVGYGVLGSLQLLEIGQILHATITRASGGDYDEPVCFRSQAEELLADLHAAIAVKDHGLKLLEAKLAAATELLRQSRKSLKRAPFNLLTGIDDFLAGAEARAVRGGKPS